MTKKRGKIHNKLKQEQPILFHSKEECCGCLACGAICPMQNITVSVDEEGFEYPVISGEKCVKCNSCISVCPLKIK